jgi:hypothetical protein
MPVITQSMARAMGADASDRVEYRADGTMLWSCTGLEDRFALDLDAGENIRLLLHQHTTGNATQGEQQT